jgi:hypothetical protein
MKGTQEGFTELAAASALKGQAPSRGEGASGIQKVRVLRGLALKGSKSREGKGIAWTFVQLSRLS